MKGVAPPGARHYVHPVFANGISRFPTPLLVLLVVGCSIPRGATRYWDEPIPALFTTGPYILLGEPGTAYIALKQDLSVPPTIEWWPTEPPRAADGTPGKRLVTRVEMVADEDLWVGMLVGLPLGPQVTYRVLSEVGETAAYTFRAGVPWGGKFRFVAYGDTRTGHYVHRSVVDAALKEEPDFLVHTGDMVERGGIQHQWDRFFQIERPLLAQTPIIPSIGNHDIGNREYFRHYFLYDHWAGNRRYYAYDWGNLRMVSVDVGIECREGCTQYGFAETVLAEGARRGMLMMIMLHYPPYSSGKHGSHKRIQKPITDLSRQHGVELVLTGHSHNYERTKLIHGTTYIVSGSAGAPIHLLRPSWFTAAARTEPHYVVVDVDGDEMVLRAVNLDGEVFDTLVITHNDRETPLPVTEP